MPEISRISTGAALVGFVFVTACSQSERAPSSGAPKCDAGSCDQAICTARFTGNTSDLVTLGDECGALEIAAEAGPDGAYLLSFHGSSSKIASADVSVYLGAAPSPGSASAESVSSWSISGLSNANTGCQFVAGSSAVPTGNLTLTLSSLSLDSTDADGGGSAHGSLNATLYVHAPPSTDCGAGELEDVSIVF